MINPITLKILNTAEQKMNAYFGLLNYRYKNLCTKAEAESMLPVEVEIEGPLFKIEEVAIMSIPEWNQIMLMPKDEEYIPYIGHAVMMVHPEFKQKVTRYFIESQDRDVKVLMLTMPPVDKDRHKLLNDGVDVLYTQCVAYIDNVKAEAGIQISEQMAQQSIDEINETRKKLDDLHKQYSKNVDGLHDDKKSEIEDAYQKYLKEHGDDAGSSTTSSSQSDVAQSMELPK